MRSMHVISSMFLIAPVTAFAQGPLAAPIDPKTGAPSPAASPYGDPSAPAPSPAASPSPYGDPSAPAPIAPDSDEVIGPGPRDREYGRAGVRELGASAGLALAQDIRALNFSPAVGWFVNDSFELSGILDVTNLKAGEGSSATMWSALVEASFHFPFDGGMFGFVGMGVGGAYVGELGAAVAVAPRIGIDLPLGRSGILRPSLAYQYTTHDAMNGADPNGTQELTLVAISSALRFNIGYSSMW